MVEILPLQALPSMVETGVGLTCIILAGAVLVFGFKRRGPGYDPMLIGSAAAVILLAVVILATR